MQRERTGRDGLGIDTMDSSTMTSMDEGELHPTLRDQTSRITEKLMQIAGAVAVADENKP